MKDASLTSGETVRKAAESGGEHSLLIVGDVTYRRGKTVDLKSIRFHDLRHFAATMFASTGASTKEIMSRGGWKSVTMVVRYEHASEERDAMLADALNPYTETGVVVPIGLLNKEHRARSAHDADISITNQEGTPSLSWENDAKSSGGETRTLNLAVNSRLLCH